MTTAERNPDGGGYPVLVMAAGASRRMGRPKALLRYGGGNLLDRALELAAVLGGPVTVVAGGHYPLVRFRTRRQPVRWLLAENWQQGLSASLQAGLASLGPGVKGCFVLLADQPALWEADLRLLGQHARVAPWHAVAADHAGRPGCRPIFPAACGPLSWRWTVIAGRPRYLPAQVRSALRFAGRTGISTRQRTGRRYTGIQANTPDSQAMPAANTPRLTASARL